ncbi:MAG TPA: tripartite tricarboxylate transporter TctB family protein [Casimicrobiaceae bacterium]|nr:tripartite tricarboxylate transporter TctB family protein [Casimicrobiaceae bacterium]
MTRVVDRLRAAWPWLAMLAAAVYLYGAAGHFAYAPRPGELGPDVWPRAILVLLIVVCALRLAGLLIGVAATGRQADAAVDGVDVDGAAGADASRRYPRLLAAGIALTILYVLSMGTLGFFVATAIYLALFMVVGRYRRPGVIVVTSVVGSLVFVYVFMKIVYVSLPLGSGPFQHVSVAVLAALGVR